MELVSGYQQIIEEARLVAIAAKRAEDPFGGDWEQFQQSTERMISVFAGRRSGKTRNLAMRAARSRYDCTIFAMNRANMQQIGSMIISLLRDGELLEYRETSTAFRIRTTTDREIYIQANTQTYGFRFDEEEIMFDEFDHPHFESIMRDYGSLFRRARHIVCVGTMRTPDRSYGKDWFRGSDLKMHIDNPVEVLQDFQAVHRHEHMPSEFLRGYAAEFLPN